MEKTKCLTEGGTLCAKMYLDEAHAYAEQTSGCCKVSVGSVIVDGPVSFSRIFGSNKTLPISCKDHGCLRVEKYGENSKLHRNPEDCRAIHSEIDAICNAAKMGVATRGMTIVVTRYPCEACARAIIKAGFAVVIYGRAQECSEFTYKMFEDAGVEVVHIADWDAPDVTY